MYNYPLKNFLNICIISFSTLLLGHKKIEHDIEPLNIFLSVQYMVTDSKYSVVEQISTTSSSLFEMYGLFISTSPSLLFPVVGNHLQILFIWLLQIPAMDAIMMFCLPMTGLFYPTWCLQSSSILLHILAFLVVVVFFFNVEKYSTRECTLFYQSTFTVFPHGCCE